MSGTIGDIEDRIGNIGDDIQDIIDDLGDSLDDDRDRFNSVFDGGTGDDTLLGTDGNHLMNAGAGLGIHVGGAGADIFAVGPDILGNGQTDLVVAFDFNAAIDSLVLDGAVLAQVASVEAFTYDIRFALDQLRADSVTGQIALDLVAAAGEANLAAELAPLFATEAGGAAPDAGSLVRLEEGDQIFVAGVNPAQLDWLGIG
jgi:hypothetical protein